MMKKVPRPGGFYVYMTENQGSYFPFPTTMKIHWDGELPPLKARHETAKVTTSGSGPAPAAPKKK